MLVTAGVVGHTCVFWQEVGRVSAVVLAVFSTQLGFIKYWPCTVFSMSLPICVIQKYPACSIYSSISLLPSSTNICLLNCLFLSRWQIVWLLGIMSCEQGTLNCNGRTDKLCVGRDTVGDTRGPIVRLSTCSY